MMIGGGRPVDGDCFGEMESSYLFVVATFPDGDRERTNPGLASAWGPFADGPTQRDKRLNNEQKRKPHPISIEHLKNGNDKRKKGACFIPPSITLRAQFT